MLNEIKNINNIAKRNGGTVIFLNKHRKKIESIIFFKELIINLTRTKEGKSYSYQLSTVILKDNKCEKYGNYYVPVKYFDEFSFKEIIEFIKDTKKPSSEFIHFNEPEKQKHFIDYYTFANYN